MIDADKMDIESERECHENGTHSKMNHELVPVP